MYKLASLLLIIVLFTSMTKIFSQEIKTSAFFMLGKYADKDWEKLTFESFDDFAVITYSFAKKEKGIQLTVTGTKIVNNVKSIVVKIPGINRIYYIIPDRENEQVIFQSNDLTYRKVLKLGYEGPIDGMGTYCGTCANEPEEAFQFVDYFLKR